MGSSLPFIFALFVLLVLSGYFSATETAFSTFNRVHMKSLASAGNRRAEQVLAMADDYDRLLSTILIGNNIVNLTSASVATVIFTRWFGDAGVTISTAVMTVLVLIFGEISPKSLAKESPESFSMFSAPLLKMFSVVLSPLNWLFSQWKKLLSRIVRVGGSQKVTDQEILTVVDEAERDGGIDGQESELIRNAVGFGDLTVDDILTPRVDMVSIEEDAAREEVARVFSETGFSRLPVLRDDVDNVVGILYLKDFTASERPVAQLYRPAVFVSAGLHLPALIRLLQKRKSHMAVVVDEHGGTEGIVTLEDAIEELIGEVWDEHDDGVHSEIEQISEAEYRVQGGASYERMRRVLGIKEESDAATVGGWISAKLGKIPTTGDRFSCEGFSVIVTGTGVRRVSEVTVRRELAESPATH